MLLVHDLSKKNLNEILPFVSKNTKILSKETAPIQPCYGCFKCWTKTPGKCIINDFYTEMPKFILHNNIFIIITKIHYGCYSPYIKNVIDRSIGILLPFFKSVNGEIHHVSRYDKFPKFIAIGYGKDITSDEKATFKNLVKAYCINLSFTQYESFIVDDICKIKDVLKNL